MSRISKEPRPRTPDGKVYLPAILVDREIYDCLIRVSERDVLTLTDVIRNEITAYVSNEKALRSAMARFAEKNIP